LPVETDSQLRARQSFSVAIPSRTVLQGTIARIAATAGVARYLVHENATSSTDADGVPSHSIAAVVEGGLDADVAQSIYINKGTGAGTFGTTTVAVTDAVTGDVTNISFSRPTGVPIFVTLAIVQLANYSGAAVTEMRVALLAYLNGLQIGQGVTRSALFAVAMSVMPSLLIPEFAIETLTLGTSSTPTGTADIAIAYNQVANSVDGNIVITGG
jgi:hypothetical protein